MQERKYACGEQPKIRILQQYTGRVINELLVFDEWCQKRGSCGEEKRVSCGEQKRGK